MSPVFNRPMVSQCWLEFDWNFHYLPTMHGRSRIEHKCLRKWPSARNTLLFASYRVPYIMPDIRNGLEERQQTVWPDIEILVVVILVRLSWVLLILEIGGEGWRLSTGEPWSKNDGNIRSLRSKLSSLILRDMWFSSFERGLQMWFLDVIMPLVSSMPNTFLRS